VVFPSAAHLAENDHVFPLYRPCKAIRTLHHGDNNSVSCPRRDAAHCYSPEIASPPRCPRHCTTVPYTCSWTLSLTTWRRLRCDAIRCIHAIQPGSRISLFCALQQPVAPYISADVCVRTLLPTHLFRAVFSQRLERAALGSQHGGPGCGHLHGLVGQEHSQQVTRRQSEDRHSESP